MSIPSLLDHIVIAGPNLGQLVDWFAERTGVVAAPGGAHPTGTANALVALTVAGQRGPHYIELIGPDPSKAGDPVPQTFGIDGLDAPRVQTYAVHPENIDDVVAASRSRGFDPGDVRDLSRRTPQGELLEWRLTGALADQPGVPFLIDWGTTTHPGVGDLPTIELLSFVSVDSAPDALTRSLAVLGLGSGTAAVEAGEPSGFRLQLRRADGRVVEL